jgi:cytochrome c oxidase subunit 2
MNDLVRRLLALPDQASTMAASIDRLHFAVISVTMLGATVVAAMALYFVVRYREGATRPSRVRRLSSRGFEYPLIASVLGLFLSFWVLGFRQYVDLSTPPAGALDVYVVAKQWMWKFSHPEGQDELAVLTVPVGRPVRLLMTSRDVIHSFYVPAFRIKQDVLPGRYTSAWFEATHPGSYDVFCAELCGVSHSYMRARVDVLSPEAYDEWLSRTRANEGVASLADQGRLVAQRAQCVSCHTADGRRHLGPTWRGLYGSWVDLVGGHRVMADEAYLTRSMMEPAADVVLGFRPLMPTYQGKLHAAEVAALLEYIKSVRAAPDPAVVAEPPLWPSTAGGEGAESGPAPAPGEEESRSGNDH